jgi:hypothetical protein
MALEPPKLDRAQRAQAIETIAALGPEDPHSLVLANDVAFAELAEANWNGLDDPVVHARLRSTIALLEPIVDNEAQVSSSVLDVGLMALTCAHALLGESEPAIARGRTLLGGHSGMWGPPVYLVFAELAEEPSTTIALYERQTNAVGWEAYAKYRLAWALRHPTIVNQERAVELLEELAAGTETWPRLGRLIEHRAALELRALGREVEIPERDCEPRRDGIPGTIQP